MATIYSPADRGFEERLAIIDRCQVALLREVVGQYGNRLTLKGGMAMRAVFGSLRLTKGIDFDRDPSLSLESAKGGLPKTLSRAATNAGIRQAVAEITKLTKTTVRARLAGQSLSGIAVRFEVEVSGRGTLAEGSRRTATVIPPASYAMAPFVVESYSNDMLAAMKVAAAMSDARNVPRDIYDLHDLSLAGANPAVLLATQPASVLEDIRDKVFGKLDLIEYGLAQQELLPYLPIDVRESLDEDRWIEYSLTVGLAVQQWASEALAIKQAGSQGRQP